MASTNWIGVNGNWDDSKMWTKGIPNATTDAIFSGPGTVTVSSFFDTARSYNVYSASDGQLQITNGGMLTLQQQSALGSVIERSGTLSFLAGSKNTTSAFTQSSGSFLKIAEGTTVAINGNSTIGGTIEGDGTLTLNRTSEIETGSALAVENLIFGSTINLDTGFQYRGNFTSETYASIVYLNGHTLALSNIAHLGGSYYSSSVASQGAGSEIQLTGTGYVDSLSLNYQVTLDDAKSINQTGYLALTNGAVLQIDAKAIWNITTDALIRGSGQSSILNVGLFEKTGGTGESDVGREFTNRGNVLVNHGTLGFIGGLETTGVMTASGAVLYVRNANTSTPNAITGSGELHMTSHGTVDLNTNVPLSIKTIFDDATGNLKLETPLSFLGQIQGFRHGDTIDIHGSNPMTAIYSKGILTVNEQGFGTIAHLNFAGTFTTSSFQFTADGTTGYTKITV